jgi:DNA-binding NtrC family response regulator
LPDLFERLNVLTLRIPPLRERPEDIEPLVVHFCRLYEQETGEKRSFLKRTLRYLESYAWPRNVRELENTVRRLCVDSEKEIIVPEQLGEQYFGGGERQPGLKTRLDTLLRSEIEDAARSGESQREAARRLGIPETTFRRLLRRFGIRGSDHD